MPPQVQRSNSMQNNVTKEKCLKRMNKPEFENKVSKLAWKNFNRRIDQCIKYDFTTCDQMRERKLEKNKICWRLDAEADVRKLVNEGENDPCIRDHDGNTPLHAACSGENSEMVKELLEAFVSKSVSIDSKNNDRVTPLQLASQNGNLKIVQLLVENGADVTHQDKMLTSSLMLAALKHRVDVVNYLMRHKCKETMMILRDEDGNTPLHYACLNKDENTEEVCRILIDNGAKVGSQNKYKQQPIHYLFFRKTENFSASEFLCRQGADINCRDECGLTPLHIAVSKGDVESTKYLLRRGADPTIQDEKKRTALLLATVMKHVDIVKVLLKVEQNDTIINIPEEHGCTPLIAASYAGHKDICELLINHHADTTLHDLDGALPIKYACQMGNTEIVKLLLEQKRNCLSAVDNNGNNLLHAACAQGHIDVAKLLIQEGISIAEVDRQGDDAFLNAVYFGQTEIIKWLIGNGADVEKKNFKGQNSLHYACKRGHLEIVQAIAQNMLEYKPDISEFVNGKDEDGETSLHYACCFGHELICELLLKHKADPLIKNKDGIIPLKYACSQQRLKTIVTKLLENYPQSTDVFDNNNNTLLTSACSGGNIEIAKLLVKLGMKPEFCDNQGDDALANAAYYGHMEVVEWLIATGADIKKENFDQQTALHHACAKGHVDVAKFLIKKLSNSKVSKFINQKDRFGRTALHYAAKIGKEELVKELSNLGGRFEIFDEHGVTALDMAIKNKHSKLIKYFESLKLTLFTATFEDDFSAIFNCVSESEFKETILRNSGVLRNLIWGIKFEEGSFRIILAVESNAENQEIEENEVIIKLTTTILRLKNPITNQNLKFKKWETDQLPRRNIPFYYCQCQDDLETLHIDALKTLITRQLSDEGVRILLIEHDEPTYNVKISGHSSHRPDETEFNRNDVYGVKILDSAEGRVLKFEMENLSVQTTRPVQDEHQETVFYVAIEGTSRGTPCREPALQRNTPKEIKIVNKSSQQRCQDLQLRVLEITQRVNDYSREALQRFAERANNLDLQPALP